MEFLVSDKNISKLCDILMKNMSIKKNESSYGKCYSIIMYYMKLLVAKHKNSNGIKFPDLVSLLNKECLQLSANFIKAKIAQKNKYISHANPMAPKHHDGNLGAFEPVDPRFSQNKDPYEDINSGFEREQMMRQYGGIQRPNNIDFTNKNDPRNNKMPINEPPQQMTQHMMQSPMQPSPQLSPQSQVSPMEANVINDMLNGHQQQQFPPREPDTISQRFNPSESLHKMKSEREQDLSYMPPKQQFNPMTSPSMLQFSNENQFNDAFFLTLEDDEADSMISNLKNDIKTSNNILSQINPYILNHLDNSQLDLLIKKLSNNITKISSLDDTEKIEKKMEKQKELVVKSEEYTSPEMYSNYMIDISPLQNVTAIELTYIDIPFVNKFSNTNKLYIIIDGEAHELLIEFEKSDIDSIVTAINNKIKDFKLVINKNPNNEIYVKHTMNKQFGINNPTDSILRLFGFSQLNYNGKNVYRCNNKVELNNSVYLYIEGIGRDNTPFIEIDITNQKNKLPIKVPMIQVPNEIFIKFKLSESSDELVDFEGNPHTLKFIFYYS